MEAHASAPVGAEPPPRWIDTAASPARIVVVEDDGDMRRLIAHVLRTGGFDVLEAEDGVGLLRCLQTSIWQEAHAGIDAIVSDIQMPDLTALEVLDALPTRSAAAPVVLVTAYGADAARATAAAMGAVAVLDKPLDWPALHAAVRRAVAIGRARRRTPRRKAPSGVARRV